MIWDTAWELLVVLDEICCFMSRERPGTRASRSELKRWCQNQAVVINGRRVKWDEKVEVPITSLVLFPKNPVTIH